jgi:hypothetical protein
MTSALHPKHGLVCILIENPTVLVALSVPLLPIQPMAFPVLFVAVDLSVQRKSYKNSKAYFAKLLYH